jgi:hypothetical protein
MPDFLTKLLAGRPHWMNAVMLFCIFMAVFYVPWDIFIKPAEEDAEVWFGIMFRGTAAKIAAVPHWFVYAAGAYGFWKMKSWMWPWAAVYVAQVAVAMLVWSLLHVDGIGSIAFGVVPFAAFGGITYLLWNARPLFQPDRSAA